MATKGIKIVLQGVDKVSSIYDRVTKRSRQMAKNIGRHFKNLAASFGVGTAGLGFLAAKFVKTAADAEETANKFDVVFQSTGKLAGAVANDLAKSFDLADSTAKKMLGDTGDLLTGFGFAGDEALEMSEKVNRLAIDLASFTNYSGGASGASQALTKLLLGETEQAKSLGVVVRQGSQEYKDRVAALQENEGMTLLQAKATTALAMATEQSKNAIGDYARTSDSTANTLKAFGQMIITVKEQIGQAIIESDGFQEALLAIRKRVAEFVESGQLQAKVKEIINSLVSLATSAREKIGAFAAAFKEHKIDIITGAITAATVALIVKVVLLSKKYSLLTKQIIINKAAMIASGKAIKDLGTRIMQAARSAKSMKESVGSLREATKSLVAQIIKGNARLYNMKIAMIALKGVGVAAVAAGFYAITKAALESLKATNDLKRAMSNLKGTEAASEESTGVRTGAELRRIRQTVAGGNQEDIDYLRSRFPRAVALAEEWVRKQQEGVEAANETARVTVETAETMIDSTDTAATNQSTITDEVATQAELEHEIADTMTDALDTRSTADTEAITAAEEATAEVEKQLEAQKEIASLKQTSAGGGAVGPGAFAGQAITPEIIDRFGTVTARHASEAEAERIKLIMGAINEAQGGSEGSKHTELLTKIADNTLMISESLPNAVSMG